MPLYYYTSLSVFTAAGLSSCIAMTVCLYPLTLFNTEASVSQLLVLILVLLVTMVGLELVSGECTEVQGERVGGGGGQD